MLPCKVGGVGLAILLLSIENSLQILVARPFLSFTNTTSTTYQPPATNHHLLTTTYQPQLNFWPWIPLLPPESGFTYSSVNGTAARAQPTPAPSSSTTPVTTITTTTARPGTSLALPTTKLSTPAFLPGQLWPFIPLRVPVTAKVLPTHNFWPFIPIVGVKRPPVRPTTVPKRPWPPSTNRYNYGEVLHKSILFFEAQRSGWLPDSNHVTWRGHSATDDRGHNWEDLTGGWYDSGDYIKFGLPMAAATSMLLWGLVEYGHAYHSLGLLDDTRDCVRWPLDYFIKAHADRFVFYGQVGDPYTDHGYWGRPEDMDMERPAYRLSPESPGSDLVAETAAALAAGHVAFRESDPGYAKTLLQHAQELFEFAETFRGSYSDSIDNAVEFYGSYNDEDELAWAAAWLYRATNKRYYLDRAQHWFRLAPSCWAQSWADKTCGVAVLLYKLTKDRQYKSIIVNIFSQWLPGGDVHYTPKGLAFRSEWGTLRYTANMVFISLVAADLGVESSSYRRWAVRQIHYMLGDSGRSYVVGYGFNSPTRPHHASSSCPSPPLPCSWADYSKQGPNAHVLFGALVGGPDSEDNYVDSRDDYIHNEVGCEYNGGFQSAVTALKWLELQMT